MLLPLSLALIMFSLGLGLMPADFGRIVRQPRALLVGGIDGEFREKNREVLRLQSVAPPPRIALQTG